jgi:uncharacterized protein (DUF433 family)
MSTPKTRTWVHVAPDAKSFYRQLFVKGRRIQATTLHDPMVHEDEPMTPEEVAQDYDVPREAVLEAIEYVRSDPLEIRQDWEREAALMEATGMNDPNNNSHPRPKVLSAQEISRVFHR